MSDERWRRVETLFHAAVALPVAERGPYLDAHCDSAPLRRQVEELLSWDGEADGFIESAIGSASAQAIEDHDPLEHRRTIGKYEIYGAIGRGGFGVVYRGRDPDLGREVAVKSCSALDPSLRRRFLQEAQIAARLQHPAIVVVHDLLLEDGMPFMVQELLAGEDLSTLIARGARLPEVRLSVAQRLSILTQVAQGLAYAHEQGVVHRDVKPANVRVLPDGSVKLLDFGVAKLLHEPTDLTQRGFALGTAGYLAPEQLEGGEIDERADIFSFGVLAFELLVERRPFRGATLSEVSYRLLHEEPPAVARLWPGCPPALGRLVGGCLEKSRERRPSTLAPVVDELSALRRRHQGDPVGESPPALVEASEESTRVVPRRGPHRWRWVLAAAAVLALVVTGSWMRQRGSQPPDGPALPVAAIPSTSPKGLAEPGGQGSAASDLPSGEGRPPAQRPTASGSLLTAEKAGRVASPAAANGEVGRQETIEEPLIEDPPLPVEELSEDAAPVAAARVADMQQRSGGQDAAASAPMTRLQAATGFTPPPSTGPAADLFKGGEVADREIPAEPVAGATLAEAKPPAARPEVRDRGQPDALLTSGAGVERPRLIEVPPPVYPRSARRRRQEGQVVVAVLVDETGAVLQALVQHSEPRGLGFEEAALAAARAARFVPAQRDGVAGKMWTDLPFEFSLAKERR